MLSANTEEKAASTDVAWRSCRVLRVRVRWKTDLAALISLAAVCLLYDAFFDVSVRFIPFLSEANQKRSIPCRLVKTQRVVGGWCSSRRRMLLTYDYS